MEKYSIAKVDIVWMDLQGAELLALKGLGNYLNSVKYIHTEVSYIEMYSGQVMFEELNKFLLCKGFNIKNNLSLRGWQEDVIYEKNTNNDIFDIVIPIGPHDKDIIKKQLEYTKKNIIGFRNIFLICYDTSISFDGCITVDEKIFPFTVDTVIKFHGQIDRNRWYLQQLLKLYAGKIISGILEKYLVIDSDTFFLKPTSFIENKMCLYNFSFEYHVPYFEHMLKLDKELIRVNTNLSGICHHMIFETKYVNEIISKIEKNHNDFFFNIFLKLVTDKNGSGASEYEIYFNYMLKNHNDKIKIRQLNWKDSDKLITETNLDYISCHWYMR